MRSAVSVGAEQSTVQRGRFEVKRQQLNQHSGDGEGVSEVNFRSITLLIFSKGTKGHSLNCSLEYYFSLQRDSMANESFLLNSQRTWSFLDLPRNRPG